jgi:hypothetical protein
MTPADKLLPLLKKVRQVKPLNWEACCPAHDDKSPSLKISEAEDGRLLLKCWAGCTAGEIVGAVGLALRDLFPAKPGRSGRRRGPSRDAIEHERMILRIGDNLLRQGQEMSETDRDRYDLARKRLGVS